MNMGDSYRFVDVLRGVFPDTDALLYGVEVGVHRGALSARLLQTYASLILYGFDSWRAHDKESTYRKSGDGVSKLSSAQQQENMQAAWLATEFAGHRARLVQSESLDAALFLKGVRQFSFVFVDADHSEPAVRADIAAWYPLVLSGGILSGHDYGHRRFGVNAAVDEFVQRENLTLNLNGSVWWVVKQ